ncbi:phasin family protein [Aureimonas sp. AU22]|jgi:phasin|uniref:phasin family protein n=1 Tax=Aureimonas sp. AU22 TaxID=1638162 RepID=UPI0007841805|nr:phasin family protein [Aureimonas sp. AU22]
MSDTENFNSGDPARDAFDSAQRAQAALGLDPSKMGEAFRTMTQKSIEQSKEAYARMKSAADQATQTLEATIENAHSGSLNLTKRALEGMRAQAEMNFAHMEKLASAKSMAEFMELQTSYMRRQVEMVADQAKEMQALSQSVAQDVIRPGRDAAQKATGQDRF